LLKEVKLEQYAPTFAPGDLLVIGTLIVLEGLLSADNALVMALIVKHLPKEEQKKALFYGLVGAFVLRGIAILFAGYLMSLWWLCGLGAAYLIYLAVKHFFQRHDTEEGSEIKPKPGASFWATVAQVEFTDLVFAVDSILVAVALVPNKHKLWVVYAGGFLGILMLRLAATFFIKLVTKYPALDNMAYALVGWAGVKLASTTMDIRADSLGVAAPHYLPQWAFWTGFALITVVGTLYAVKAGRQATDEEKCDDAEETLDRLEEGDFVFEDVGNKFDTRFPPEKKG